MAYNFIYLVKGHKKTFMAEQLFKQNSTANLKLIDECIFKIAENDLSYMSELYNLTNTTIYSYALSLLKNKQDAEDVTHDCYISVYNNAYQYESIGKPLAWMITITRNLALTKLKEKNKFEENDIADYQIADKDNSLSIVDKITLETCLNQLSSEERQVVILHAIAGFKHREIAKILNLSLSGALSKYNRAIKKMKAQYVKGVANE